MQIPILAAALVCGLALSACGAEEPAAADREETNRDAMLAYAKCMREHGVDMPDPQPGQRGIRLRAPEGVTPEEMEQAEGACRKHLDDIEGPELTDEQQKEFREAALAHARCMREHGIDIPDPTFGEDGRRRDPHPPPRRRQDRARPGRPEVEGSRGGLPRQAAVRRRAALDRGGAVKRAAAAALGVAAVVAAVVLAAGGDEAPPVRAAPPRPPPRRSSGATWSTARASAARSATRTPLRCSPARPAPSTGLPEPGGVIRRGESLYRLDDEPAAWLLYGSLPAWRDFSSGMTDGEDVRQLERNLRALGHDPDGDMTVDDDWDWATTAAVLRFQDERGLTEDGTLARGEVVFRPGAARAGELRAALGQSVAPGAQIAELSTTRREVTVDLEATRQSLAREGAGVTVELPDGRTARGRITDVGKVAEQPAGDEGEPTIEVTIALRGKAARGRGFDQAPVDVGFEAGRREDVLVVPVTALLARGGGGFAVETAEGRLIEVEPGAYAEDYVEVAGDGLSEGMKVVTAG